ncbi:MAG: hypothetical protein ACRDH5_15390, partial [bacterium]
TTSRYSLLDNHKPYLNHRWTSGHTNTPSARPDHTTRWCHCRIARPTENPARHRMDHARSRESVRQDSVRLKEILARCPELDTTRRHVDSFASMIRDLTGDRITDWMDRVRDNLPALHSFVKGLRQDLAAVTAGLTLPWSNGRAWPGPG